MPSFRSALPIRYAAACGVAASALFSAAPGVAAQEMTYEQRVYEYAQPLPEGETETVFVREPVVQPIPAETQYANGYEAVPAEGYDVEYEVEYAQGAPVYTHGPAGVMHPPRGPVVHQPVVHRQPVHQPVMHRPSMPQQGYPPMPPVVDRSAWIDDCRAYVKERRRQGDRGATFGGLLGAIAGGVVGNRVASSERLGGTLIGAGVGGLAGLAIGSAVALAKGDPDKRNCKKWLKRYEDGIAQGGFHPGGYPGGAYYPAQGYPGNGWGGHQSGWHQSGSWGWSGGYIVVPVTTVIVEHGGYVPVIREVVTEEWVEDVVYEKEVHYQRVPAKKVRYIKEKPTKRVKYIKK